MKTNSKRKSDDEKKKKKGSILEREIFRIMETSMKTALNQALDELFKEWK